jgi:hypothetical protein
MHCALSVEEPKSLVFNVIGVVNVVAGSTPTAAVVEVGTEEIPGTVKVFPGNADPSTIVPLAFSITLQMVIEPIVGVAGVVDVGVVEVGVFGTVDVGMVGTVDVGATGFVEVGVFGATGFVDVGAGPVRTACHVFIVPAPIST